MATETNDYSPLVSIGRNFWTLRAKFVVAGVLNVGTHMAFIKLESGHSIQLIFNAI